MVNIRNINGNYIIKAVYKYQRPKNENKKNVSNTIFFPASNYMWYKYIFCYSIISSIKCIDSWASVIFKT